MRTLVIAIPSWNSKNPVPSQFQYLAEELVKRGDRVIVLVPKTGEQVVSTQENLSVFQWPSKRPTKLQDGFFLYRIINHFKPDCLIANFAATNWMMLLGKLAGVPVRITWYHTLYEAVVLDSNRTFVNQTKNQLLVWRKSIIYKMATHIVPVSNGALIDLQHVYHVNAYKCQVIHNLLSDPYRSMRDRLPANPNVITSVGRCDYSKGHDVLIRAMSLLHPKFPDLHLRIIGDGPRKAELMRMASSLNVHDYVTFVGRVSHDEVLRELSASYINIHPARMDNCPLVLIESLAMGTPIVASDVGGIPEIIRNDTDGLLIEPEFPEQLSSAIQSILEKKERRDYFSSNSRTRFLDTFELAKGIEQQIAWLYSLINNN